MDTIYSPFDRFSEAIATIGNIINRKQRILRRAKLKPYTRHLLQEDIRKLQTIKHLFVLEMHAIDRAELAIVNKLMLVTNSEDDREQYVRLSEWVVKHKRNHPDKSLLEIWDLASYGSELREAIDWAERVGWPFIIEKDGEDEYSNPPILKAKARLAEIREALTQV